MIRESGFRQLRSEQASSSSAAAVELDIEGIARSLLASLHLVEEYIMMGDFKAAIHAFPRGAV